MDYLVDFLLQQVNFNLSLILFEQKNTKQANTTGA